MIFFDFETTQEKVVGQNKYGPLRAHQVNCVHVHFACPLCMNNEHIGNCGTGTTRFVSNQSSDQFCEWLFEDAEDVQTTATAHNMKGFDGHFILKYLQEQAIISEIVPKGLEIMSIKYKVLQRQGVRFYGEHLACVPYTHVEDFIEELANTNVVIGAFVTSQARLKLYSYLEKLERRVLYMDRDSIIYLTAPDDTYEVPTGCFLGEMTNELKGYGEQSFIKEYVGAGPKNYGYRVWDPTKEKMVNETLKVRGFHIDYATGKSVNFGVLRRMVESFIVEKEEITKTIVQNRILREKNRNVVTKTCKKDYRVVYDKRVILPDFTTLPYGF